MARRTQFPVRYMSKARAKTLGIDLGAFPNAGPHPSITGMRKLFWGEFALLVRQGNYLYNVTSRPDVYYSAIRRG
jgi:hypothetical protein